MLFIHSSTKDSLCNESLILYTHTNEYITRRATNYMVFHSTRLPIIFKTRNHSYSNLHILSQKFKSSLQHTSNAQQQGQGIDVSTCWVTTPSQNAVSLDGHSTSLQVRCTTEMSNWATVPLLLLALGCGWLDTARANRRCTSGMQVDLVLWQKYPALSIPVDVYQHNSSKPNFRLHN
jgi:hypothetical protein